jgi:hypothetical protein
MTLSPVDGSNLIASRENEAPAWGILWLEYVRLGGGVIDFSSLDPEQAYRVALHTVGLLTNGVAASIKGIRALRDLRRVIGRKSQGADPQSQAVKMALDRSDARPTDGNVRAELVVALVALLRSDASHARRVMELLDRIDLPMTEFAGEAKAKGQDTDLVIGGHVAKPARILAGARFEAEGINANTVIGVKIGD